MIQRVPLFLDFRLPANSPGAFLLALCGTLHLGSGLLPLAARGLGGLHSLPYGLPGELPHHRVHHHIPYPSHVVTELSPLSKERRTALGPAYPPPARSYSRRLVACSRRRVAWRCRPRRRPLRASRPPRPSRCLPQRPCGCGLLP